MGQTSTRDQQAASYDHAANSIRLDSWKEIASYLHRDARTVRRWERERRLPVHRVPGGERSGVFAYVSELEQWLRTPDEPAAAPSVVLVDDASEAFIPPEPDRIVELLHAKERKTAPSKALEDAEHSAAVHIEPQSQTSSDPPVAGTSGVLQSFSSPRAFYATALTLLVSIVAGSIFAFVHYRRFHQQPVANMQPSPDAQELYLRGRYFWNLRTEEGLSQATDLFTQAIVHDPHYAAAYAGLADSYLLLRQYGHMPDAEAYPRALAAARQAIALDAACPDAHRSIAFILRFWNWDMPAAEKEYQQAIALDPKNAQSHHWYATALLSSGRIDQALDEIDTARALEPQSVSVLADRGLILSYKDRPGGIEALKEVTKSQPEFVSAHRYLSEIYLNTGDFPNFLAEARAAAMLDHDTAKTASLDQALKDLTHRGSAVMVRSLADRYATLADRGEVSAYLTARLFGLAGESTQAIHYLQVACDRRDPGFLRVEADRAFQGVRSSPEYMTLLGQRDAAPDGRRQPIARLDRVAF